MATLTYSTAQTVKRARRRIGEMPYRLVRDISRMSREEQVRIKIAASMASLIITRAGQMGEIDNNN